MSGKARFEFTGRLTKAESGRWVIWQVFRIAPRRYAIWFGGWVGLASMALAISYRHLLPTLYAVLRILVALHVVFVGYLLYLLARGITLAARYNPDKHPENTVRLYDNKIEMVFHQEFSHQFEPTALRLRRTRFGIVCENRRTSQIFLLPSRILTQEHLEKILRLYSVAAID